MSVRLFICLHGFHNFYLFVYLPVCSPRFFLIFQSIPFYGEFVLVFLPIALFLKKELKLHFGKSNTSIGTCWGWKKRTSQIETEKKVKCLCFFLIIKCIILQYYSYYLIIFYSSKEKLKNEKKIDNSNIGNWRIRNKYI